MHGVIESTPWGNYSTSTMARIGIEIGKNSMEEIENCTQALRNGKSLNPYGFKGTKLLAAESTIDGHQTYDKLQQSVPHM
jgi:hypothetical protein